MRERKRIFGYFEVVFDIAYLLAALLIGLYLLSRGTDRLHILSGVMALTLVGGDVFHLVPRIAAVLTGNEARWQRPLGFGKLVTSVTMTVFYILLWELGLLIFPGTGAARWTGLVYTLAAARVLLCLLPQNRWYDAQSPVTWGIYRNLPFFLLGTAVAWLFASYGERIAALAWMWSAIALSFIFYLPVVLWVNRQPKLGMLMLPKSCAYIWMLFMLVYARF